MKIKLVELVVRSHFRMKVITDDYWNELLERTSGLCGIFFSSTIQYFIKLHSSLCPPFHCNKNIWRNNNVSDFFTKIFNHVLFSFPIFYRVFSNLFMLFLVCLNCLAETFDVKLKHSDFISLYTFFFHFSTVSYPL